MLLNKNFSIKGRKHLTKMSFFIIHFIILSNLISIHAIGNNSPYDVENIIEFNHKKFKAGNFATNKNGELFIEYYSEEDRDKPASRLFYGRTKNGIELFFNESSFTQELDIGLDETEDISQYYNYFKIYNSKNLFATIKNEPNKENQYLFSINSYDWSVELHKFNNNINTAHYLWNFNDFFNLNEKKYRFRYETTLLELKVDSSYIIAFLPKDDINENMNELSFMKKFKFQSFSEDAYEEINAIEFKNYINKRIISVFLMDDTFIVVISMEETEEEGKEFEGDDDLKLRSLQFSFQFTLNFYYSDLDPLELGNNNILYIEDFYYDPFEDLFFKTISLKNGYTIFAWIPTYDYIFIIGLYKLSYSFGGYPIEQIYDINIYFNLIEEILSDFVKINDRKIVFICTNAYLEENNSGGSMMRRNQETGIILNIVVINVQQYYQGLGEIQIYHVEIENYILTLQISGFFYNDYLLFTSTALSSAESYNYDDDSNYLSIFMMFGYPNGTDSIIDISPFLYLEESSREGDSLFDYLSDNLIIENNIFSYVFANRIKLVSIPDELIIIQMDNGNTEGNQLQNNSELNRDNTYIIKQNIDLNKTSKYYYIDYQYIVKENEDDYPQVKPGGPRILDSEESKLYYGRINRLQFKLCHEYCETCLQIGITNREQKCTSCLPEYQYNYFTFINNNNFEENEINCVPEEYFFVQDSNELQLCDETNSKFYINTTDNKKICFDSHNECPEAFPLLNGRECFNCDLAHYNKGDCNEDTFKEKSCAQCNFDCYMMDLCDYNNFDTTNEDFYVSIKSGGFISNYDGEHGDIKISNGDGYTFQITTVENELQ